MKRLFAVLALVGLSAIAGPAYNLKNGTHDFPLLKAVQYTPDNTYYAASPSNSVTYTVTGSVNRTLMQLKYDQETKTNYTELYNGNGKTAYDLAHVYFTANNDFNLALFTDIDKAPTGELRVDSRLNITDYGIYLYEGNDPANGIAQYISLSNDYYSITSGTNFGVYYTGDTEFYVKDPKFDPNTYGLELERENSYNVTYTTDDNWVASFDGAKEGNHHVEADAAWYSDTFMSADEAILCLFQGPFEKDKPAYLEWEHVEFGFVDVGPQFGQPLPGAMATLLLGGAFFMRMRKRKK